MRGEAMPEGTSRIDRIERQVALISEKLGIPWEIEDAGLTYSGGSEFGAVPPDVLELVQRGEKIAAIKRYRELTGCGLKEAKDAVEAL